MNEPVSDRGPGSFIELKSAAMKFRLAIARCDPRKLGDSFTYFPRGSCGPTAELLGVFLQERGLGRFRYSSGTRRDNGRLQTHAWLEAEGVIVDITADQFPEVDEQVIVADNSEWHASFTLEVGINYSYAICDLHSDLGSTYSIILAEVMQL